MGLMWERGGRGSLRPALYPAVLYRLSQIARDLFPSQPLLSLDVYIRRVTMPEPTELRVVEAARRGDAAALTALYEHFKQDVFRFIFYRVHPKLLLLSNAPCCRLAWCH